MMSPEAIAAGIEYQKEHINESRAPMIMATVIAWFIIPYVAVTLRLISRRISRTALKWDDWCILISLPFTTIYTSLTYGLKLQGLGRHAILVKNLRKFAQLGIISEVTYCVALPIIKFSTLLLLHRIFPEKSFARRSWVIAAIIVAYTIAQVTCLLMQCVPLSFLWNPMIKVHCIKLSPVLITCSVLNIITDLAIFCLPIPRLWALQITKKYRIQIISMFLLGTIVCVISIVRLPKLIQFSFWDASWKDVDFAVWSGYELTSATVSACVPTWRPLLNWICGSRRRRPNQAPGCGGGSCSGSTSKSMLYGPQTYITATYVPTPQRYASFDENRRSDYHPTSMMQADRRPDSRLSFSAVREGDVVKMTAPKSGIYVKTEWDFVQEICRVAEEDGKEVSVHSCRECEEGDIGLRFANLY